MNFKFQSENEAAIGDILVCDGNMTFILCQGSGLGRFIIDLNTGLVCTTHVDRRLTVGEQVFGYGENQHYIEKIIHNNDAFMTMK
jgi:hypothetical protein